jgi:hypothetical protein
VFAVHAEFRFCGHGAKREAALNGAGRKALLAAALAILMGRQQRADFWRMARQLNARQRKVPGYQTAGKKGRIAPGRDVFYSLLGRMNPTALF